MMVIMINDKMHNNHDNDDKEQAAGLRHLLLVLTIMCMCYHYGYCVAYVHY